MARYVKFKSGAERLKPSRGKSIGSALVEFALWEQHGHVHVQHAIGNRCISVRVSDPLFIMAVHNAVQASTSAWIGTSLRGVYACGTLCKRKMISSIDHFGFLPVDKEIAWGDGKVIPLEDLLERIDKIVEKTNKDGYIYPPIISHYKMKTISEDGRILFSDELERTEVPRTKRPALLHRLPMSHRIELYTTPIENNFREGDGAFLMHFIGFLFGFRLQFKDWWHDGRIYMQGRRWVVIQGKVEEYIAQAYNSWRSWPKIERIRFTNLLYMNNRCDTYEWDWERFAINYMVFDSCFEMSKNLNKWKRGSHSKRFNTLFTHFGIPKNEKEVAEILNLRNELFHESLWDKGQPCSGGIKGYRQADNLKRINERLITALAGCETDFIQTRWWSVGQFLA